MAVVILEPYSNFTLTLPQVELVQYFPQSLLAASLEYPGLIVLTNPVVTPELLQEIYRILTTHRLDYYPLPQTNLRGAANYLNMMTLLLLEEPLLPLFQALYPRYNLLDPQTWSNPETQESILFFVVDNNACVMLDVFLQLLPREHELELDASLLAASQEGHPECVRLLLKREDPSKTSTYTERKVAPSERITSNGALYLAITHFRPENVRVLLDDPRTTFKFTETFPPTRILEVIPKHRYDIFAMIISDPRLTPEDIVPYLTGYFSNPPLVRLLLTSQDLDLNDSELSGYIRETLTPTRSGNEIEERSEASDKYVFESTRIVFSDPRFDPNLFLKATFEFPTFISSQALRDLLMDPRVDINALPDSFYISLIYLNSPEVLRAFLERPDISRTTLLKLYQSATLPLYPKAEPRNAALAVNLIRPRLTDPELQSGAIIDYTDEAIEILGFVIETYFP